MTRGLRGWLFLAWVAGLLAVGPVWPARAGAVGYSKTASQARLHDAQAEEEQARTIRAITARVEALEQQAQAAVQAERAATHRAVLAINALVSLILMAVVLLALLGHRGLRDIRRMTRRIRFTREQTGREVRDLSEMDLTAEIGPELKRTLDELGRRLDLLEELGQPLEASDCVARGNVWYAQGDYGRAVSWYHRATAQEPELADAHYRKGIALERLGRREEALASFDRVIELDPSDPEASYVKGLVLHDLGQREGAVAALGRAIALSPQWARPFLARATALARLGRREESLADLTRAVSLDSRCLDEAEASHDFDSLRDHPEYRKLVMPSATATHA